MKGIAVVKCSCKHEFQDNEYGHGMRVANATKGGNQDTVVVRCTVCSNQQTVNKKEVK